MLWQNLLQVLAAFALSRTCDAKMNVLFLVSDDMRPEMSAYLGPDYPTPIHPRMHTPGLDYLASESLVLKLAYVQQAVCSPSRTSLLTGRRPDTTRVYDLETYFRKSGGNFTTIPQYFKQNGYRSVGIGKVFHSGKASDNDDPISWSEPYYHAPNLHYWDTNNFIYRSVTKAEREAKPLPDEQLVDRAIEKLQEFTNGTEADKPFFLAVGLRRPHLPWVFPEEYLDMYPMEDIRVPDNNYAPVNMPLIAWYDSEELSQYKDFSDKYPHFRRFKPNTSLPEDEIRTLRRAYYCSLSHADAQILRVLNEVKRLGLDNNTIVSFWGDHGWQLSEHGEWSKQTNFELATHAPMMIRIPGLTDGGKSTEKLTEFVDLYPTLVEAAGLPPPPLCPVNSSQVRFCREGQSLIPLIKNPDLDSWKKRVFSQYPHPTIGNAITVMGYTMRTDRYRYTEYPKFSGSPAKPQWSELSGVELYDHGIDPEENVNRAGDSGYRLIAQGLSKLLRAGWRGALTE